MFCLLLHLFKSRSHSSDLREKSQGLAKLAFTFKGMGRTPIANEIRLHWDACLKTLMCPLSIHYFTLFPTSANGRLRRPFSWGVGAIPSVYVVPGRKELRNFYSIGVI
jgi:hypothetical protein